MHPFIHIGPLTAASYGLMICIGIFVGVLLLYLRTRKGGLPFQDVLYSYFFGLIGLAVGAKLMYIIQALPKLISHFSELSADPARLLVLITGGFVFYGGLIGGIGGVGIYAKIYKISFRTLLEALIPVVPLVHAFGRIGCFMAGCCYGIPYDGPLHVVFGPETFGLANVPLFPVQLLESALLFCLFVFLLLYDRFAKRPRSLVGWYLLLYAFIRMGTELLRGDEIRGSFLIFSTSQWISIALIVVAILILIKWKGVPAWKIKPVLPPPTGEPMPAPEGFGNPLAKADDIPIETEGVLAENEATPVEIESMLAENEATPAESENLFDPDSLGM
ncbi:MAG: prolipoprotein diacylglyceryl transferase [Coriobacteriia bacterium]|nr:prolipoprotein diacylglyceryl transferase [Coriobacteriia bacterium]